MFSSVSFRCDAGAGIGLGHLKRCLALAEAFRRFSGLSIFVITKTPAAVKPFCPGFVKVVSISEEISSNPESIPSHSGLLFVDHYGFTPSMLKRLRSPKHKVVFVDDMMNLSSYPVDYVINYHAYARRSFFQKRSSARLFLGPRYALISARFASSPISVNPSGLAAFLSLGGAAPARFYNEFTDCLKANKCRIVTASGSSRQIDQLMRQSDFAVTAAGVTAYELACLGVPSAYVVIAENQRRVASSLAKLGCGVLIGHIKNLNRQKLSSILTPFILNSKLRSDLSKKAKRLIDGAGCERIVKALIKAGGK